MIGRERALRTECRSNWLKVTAPMKHDLKPGTRVILAHDITPPEPKYLGEVGTVIGSDAAARSETLVFVRWPDGSEVGYPKSVIVRAKFNTSSEPQPRAAAGQG